MTRSRILTIFSAVAVFLACVMLPCALSAEEVVDNDFGYSLDIPEGYSVAGYTPDGMSYQFKHDRLPVELVLKLYSTDQFSDCTSALKGALSKLSVKYDEIDNFEWRNTNCAITIFDSKALNQKGSTGWAVSVALPGKDYSLVLLCYADADKANDCEQFIMSTLNSLAIDRGSYFSPGIITTYAYPETSPKTVNLNIAGKRIVTSVDSEASEANEFVIGMEYAVLTLYANNEKWKEAWTRFYKAIYRDSFSRLKKVAFDVNSALYPMALKKNPKHPEVAINEMLLEWVQNFDYVRAADRKSTDFTNVVDAISGFGSDCDSRSMLNCILMKHLGVNTALFVSAEYSHAVYGIDVDLEGAKIEAGDKWYLLNETTAKGVKPGLIAQDQSDTTKWLPILFY